MQHITAPAPSALGGFFYPYRGLRFLFQHPRLFPYVAVPVAINTLLFSLFAWFVSSRFSDWLDRLLPQGDAWYWTALSYLLTAVFGLGLLVFVVYTFTLVGNLLLAPFNEFLSEKVERLHVGFGPDQPFQLSALLADTVRSVKAELGRLALYAGGFLLLLLLHLVPGVGTLVYGPALALFTLFFLGWEYTDYTMERWKLSFARKRRMTLGNTATLLTFGAGTALLLLIPLLQLLAIPVCVIGATLLACDLRAAGRLPD